MLNQEQVHESEHNPKYRHGYYIIHRKSYNECNVEQTRFDQHLDGGIRLALDQRGYSHTYPLVHNDKHYTLYTLSNINNSTNNITTFVSSILHFPTYN